MVVGKWRHAKGDSPGQVFGKEIDLALDGQMVIEIEGDSSAHTRGRGIQSREPD